MATSSTTSSASATSSTPTSTDTVELWSPQCLHFAHVGKDVFTFKLMDLWDGYQPKPVMIGPMLQLLFNVGVGPFENDLYHHPGGFKQITLWFKITNTLGTGLPFFGDRGLTVESSIKLPSRGGGGGLIVPFKFKIADCGSWKQLFTRRVDVYEDREKMLKLEFTQHMRIGFQMQLECKHELQRKKAMQKLMAITMHSDITADSIVFFECQIAAHDDEDEENEVDSINLPHRGCRKKRKLNNSQSIDPEEQEQARKEEDEKKDTSSVVVPMRPLCAFSEYFDIMPNAIVAKDANTIQFPGSVIELRCLLEYVSDEKLHPETDYARMIVLARSFGFDSYVTFLVCKLLSGGLSGENFVSVINCMSRETMRCEVHAVMQWAVRHKDDVKGAADYNKLDVEHKEDLLLQLKLMNAHSESERAAIRNKRRQEIRQLRKLKEKKLEEKRKLAEMKRSAEKTKLDTQCEKKKKHKRRNKKRSRKQQR